MNKRIIFCLLISINYCSKTSVNITDDTLAIVNQRTITKEQFSAQAQSLNNVPGVNLATKDGRIDVLKQMVNEELVFQQALKDEFYLQNLNVKHEIVKEYLKEKFGKNLPVITDEMVKKYYTEHQSELDAVRASHILIKADEKSDAATKQKAKEKAINIRNQIVHGKITFVQAVKKFSEDDASKRLNGDLSFFNKSMMVGPFSDATFALKKIGDISPVIETKYGYHIIQLTGQQRGFDTYKEKLRWKMSQDIMQPKVDDYFGKLRENAKIELLNKDMMNISIPQS